MKTHTRSAVRLAVLLAAGAAILPAQAQWTQTSTVGPSIYTDPANWAGGIVTNAFPNPVISGLTVTFTNDYILSGGVLLNFPGSSNVTFMSDSATPRTLHISLGHFLRTNQNGGTITIGTTNNPLILDLYNSTRTLGGGLPLNSSFSTIGTMNVYAQIVDLAGGTNGVNLAGGNMYTYLLNNNNSFVGPVKFVGYRGGGFTSIKKIGAGPSALGAPTDTTNGTISITDSTSSGTLAYLGTGDTSDRPFDLSAVNGSLYVFQNSGSGQLTLTGPWTLQHRTNTFTFNAASNHIELDGYLKGVGMSNNLAFKAVNSTNRNILTCPTNDFTSLEVDSGILAYTGIAAPGQPSPLGAGANIVLAGGALQYTGPSVTNSRTLLFSNTSALFPTVNWSVENASNTLTLAADFAGAITDQKTKTIGLGVFNTATIEVQGAIPDLGGVNPTTLVVGNATGVALNNGGTVRLLCPTNSYSGATQVKYARTLQVASLADAGLPCALGLGNTPPSGFTSILLGSTDSQRGGALAYIGTDNASCNRQITILGQAAQSGGTILNNSPNNSSLHLSDTGALQFNSAIAHAVLNLGGSAVATNIYDEIIPNVPTNLTSLVVQGSIWQLTAAHSYSDTTIVTNGTLLLEGSIGPGADVTVLKGGVLGGNGTINNNVNVQPNGTLSPGDFVIGALTINGNLTNNGTIYMELNKNAHTNDFINLGANAIAYGGALVVTNQAGTLVLNDSFTLFAAGSYQGTFTSVSPSPGPGLAWDLSLLSSGVIKVIAGPTTPPVINNLTVAGTNLVFSGTNGSPSGPFYVVSATNVALPMSSWSRVGTNAFDSNGGFNVTNAINPSTPQRFFRLQVPQ